ncbi:hypothetical protein GCM10025783_32680 [Amnibacterium soli]|uniref:EthD domain-containing protein n=1 Tax=Amnibacterium soli TaxID=1282736 RepID=A0ABP8ZIM7_9MICO
MPDTISSPDFAARDAAIAVNSYTTVVGRSTVPEERFRAYWRDAHGPLCARIPALGFYVQHHFARTQDAHLWPVIDGVAPLPGYVLDGAVEIGWPSEAAQQEFQRASSILFGDEQNVFEETVAYPLPTGSTTVFDREPDPIPNGPDRYDRLHVHFTPRAGQAERLADLLRGEVADAVATAPGAIKVRVHAPDDHDNSTPNPPAPNVAHTVVAERVRLVVLEVAFTDPLARRRAFDTPAFTATLAAQRELAQHITAFPVSGVFTFVRDSALTTAGLRGSRVAEVIRDLAATNQVADDVVGLMRTGAPTA